MCLSRVTQLWEENKPTAVSAVPAHRHVLFHFSSVFLSVRKQSVWRTLQSNTSSLWKLLQSIKVRWHMGPHDALASAGRACLFFVWTHVHMCFRELRGLEGSFLLFESQFWKKDEHTFELKRPAEDVVCSESVPSQRFFNLVSATFSVPLIYDKGSFLDILKPITSTCHCWDCDPLHVFWRRLLRLHLTSFCCIFPINPFFCSPGMFFQNLSDSSYHLFQGLRREIFYFLGPFWFTVGSVFTRILDQIGVNVH